MGSRGDRRYVRMVNAMHQFDRGTSILDACTPAREDLLVYFCVKIREASEFDLLTIVRHRAVGESTLALDVFWQVVCVG